MKVRVAIIGAGPCGLGQLHAFEQARKQGADVPELVCFEKQSDWGGLWNLTWLTRRERRDRLLEVVVECVIGELKALLGTVGP